MDLNKLSTQEIKALGFDQQTLLQQTQMNLQIINQELLKRAEAEKVVEVKKEK